MFGPKTNSQAGSVRCQEPYKACNITDQMHVCKAMMSGAVRMADSKVAVDLESVLWS